MDVPRYIFLLQHKFSLIVRLIRTPDVVVGGLKFTPILLWTCAAVSFWAPPMATASVMQMLLFQNRFRRHLWTELYETLTHDVLWFKLRSAVEHCEEIFLGIGPQKLGPKTTYFRRLRNSAATLRVNISGKEHDIDNRETALETTRGPLHSCKILFKIWSTNR